MRPLRVADSANIVLGLQDEMRRSEESPLRPSAPRRVAGGARHDGPEVAKLLGDARRSVEYWVRGFAEEGWAGLREGERGGRPRRLSEKQLQQVHAALRQRPRGLGGNRWDGKTLAAWIQRQYGISLGVRQCQRLFRQLGFGLRQPRPAMARADPERQRRPIKKTPSVDGRGYGRAVGPRRSALPATRFPLPDVGTTGNQGPRVAASP